MSDMGTPEHGLMKALETVDNFIAETTGQKPTQQEIANALKRYFVLNEIKAHIVMEREENPG
jgi:hypothetical protein